MINNENYKLALNELLSSYQVHYQNLRSAHWNIKGRRFFELHVKFEEWYTRTQVIIDDVAERILTIGNEPYSTFTDYLKASKIQEMGVENEANKCLESILSGLQSLEIQVSALLQMSSETDDEGTNALMSDLLREHQKDQWMIRAILQD